jgi:hypothetical protein
MTTARSHGPRLLLFVQLDSGGPADRGYRICLDPAVPARCLSVVAALVVERPVAASGAEGGQRPPPASGP